MKRQERARAIEKILEDLFPNPSIPLNHKDPYTLLIATLLSAQCTDQRVNRVTPLLFSRAETPQQMNRLSVSEIEEIIRPCGLSKMKAASIWKLSEQIDSLHQGKVPDNFEELEKLPGVGHKTASVLMACSFGHPSFPVDTHIHRSARRWGLSRAKNVKQTEKDLKELFPKEKWIKIHLQILYFARKHCPARGHKTEECPICRFIKNN